MIKNEQSERQEIVFCLSTSPFFKRLLVKHTNSIIIHDTTVDGRITSQNDGTHALYFRYDHNNSLVGLNLDGTEYLYLKNGQGDIEGILDTTGTLVVSYTYDAWGKVLSCTGTLASAVDAINPIRYRDYYLDSETGYYYLQSRYYNPEFCRFINADEPAMLALSAGNVRGANLFAYCQNNPVNNNDTTGNATDQTWNLVRLLIKNLAITKARKSIPIINNRSEVIK